MRFTLNWLKSFLDTKATLAEITHKLTMIGLEIESVTDYSQLLADFTVAEIIDAKPHPDADKLQICQVQTGQTILQIVCGAVNARPNLKVVLANSGVRIPNGDFKIKKSKIRGVESNGMLCSLEELNLPGDSSGIIELPTDANIGTPAAAYLGADDAVIEINITPNRSDALGVYGIARDLAAAGLGTLKPLNNNSVAEVTQLTQNLAINASASVKLFTMRQLVRVNNSLKTPAWLANYLELVGIGTISPVVDVTNYIAYSFGQPMHAYDADKIQQGLVVNILSREQEFLALDGKIYKLAAGDLVIQDEAEQVQCLAGIIGAQSSACDATTTNILLEAAVFNADPIINTGRRLNIDTDSRYRFERGVDANFTTTALDFATNLITQICQAQATNSVTWGVSGQTSPIQIDFPTNCLREIAGIDLPIDQIQDILKQLGFQVQVTEPEILLITVPSWRHDVGIKEDIVEEIIRIHGYDQLPITPIANNHQARVVPPFWRRHINIKRQLAAQNFQEIVSWSFMHSKQAASFAEFNPALQLQNPISSNLDYMRPSIIPNLLSIAANNLNRSCKNFSLFELGPVFIDDAAQIVNEVAGIRVGNAVSKNHLAAARAFDVYDIKADVACILAAAELDVDNCQIVTETVPSYYHPTRAAKLMLGKNILGYFGQIHPQILADFDITQPIIAFEVKLDNLPYPRSKFAKRSKFERCDYQPITRDYAFIAEQEQEVGAIIKYLSKLSPLIKTVELFDIYIGDRIPEGKKSLAISLTIQGDKTLTAAEIKPLHDLIITQLHQKFNLVLRDA